MKTNTTKKEPFNIDIAKEKYLQTGKKLDSISPLITIKERETRELTTYKVTQSVIHPSLMNNTTREAYYKDGFVYVLTTNGNEEKFFFSKLENKNIIETIFKNDDKLVFFLGSNYFHVTHKDKYDSYMNAVEELQRLYNEKGRLSKEIYLLENAIEKYEFWQQYKIPYKFVVDIKPVSSGLLEKSNGSGSNKATVRHIILKQNIDDGKLKRNTNEFLCSQPKGLHFYSEPIASLKDEFQEVVTCKQCLEKIWKYKKV